MRKIILFFLILGALGCASTALEKGDKNYKKGNYEAARKSYDELLKGAPNNLEIDLKKASSYEQEGKLDRALAAYSTLIKKYSSPTPRLYRARLLYKMDDAFTALKDLDRLLFSGEKAKDDIKILAYSLQGEIFYNQENLKKSLASFSRALNLGESKTSFKATYHYRYLLYNTGRVEFALGSFKKARTHFGKYIEKKKLNGLTIDEEDLYFYVLILKYNNDFEEAEKYEAKLSMESKEKLSKAISQ